MRYHVERGRHDFRPLDSINVLAPWRRCFRYRVRFHADCDYTLTGDQWDWNKGGGASFSLFSNTRNAVMWAWRWHPVLQKIQVCAYWHRDGKAYYAENTDDVLPFAIALETELEVTISKLGVNWHVTFKIGDGTKTIETTAQGLPVRPIGLWFGGNNPAPKLMSITVQKL